MIANDIAILLTSILRESLDFKSFFCVHLLTSSKRKNESCFILNTLGYRHIEQENRI